MAGFNAGEVVDALDYDFTAVGGPKGTIPEPDDTRIEKFRKALGGIVAETLKARESAQASVAETGELTADTLLSALESADLTAQLGRAVDAVADLCQGSPTRDQIEALPWRHKQAFFAWLVGQLLDPTPRTPATSR